MGKTQESSAGRDDPDRQRGLYGKFDVRRSDGSSDTGGKHENCFFFVLDPVHDGHARPALAAYANAVREEFPLLAGDLFEVLRNIAPAEEGPDRAYRPTSDGRPDAVPPLTPVEAIGALVLRLLEIQPSSRTAGVIIEEAKAICSRNGLGAPRRGWQSIVTPAPAGGR